MSPRKVLFFPSKAGLIGVENSWSCGIFFAKTGAAFATKAGRKMMKIWRRLASDIVGDEKDNHRHQYVGDCEYALSESESKHISSVDPYERNTPQYYKWKNFCTSILPDMHTWDMRNCQKCYEAQSDCEDDRFRMDDHDAHCSDCCSWRGESGKITFCVLFFHRESDESIKYAADIEPGKTDTACDRPYPESRMESEIDEISDIVEVDSGAGAAEFPCYFAIDGISEESDQKKYFCPEP